MTILGKFHQTVCGSDLVTVRVGMKLPLRTVGSCISKVNPNYE